MDLRLTVAILCGKVFSFVLKLFGSGATAAPGLLALKIDPNLVTKLSQRIRHGSIIISGTNGKTTTSRLIADLVTTSSKIIHNRQGSNLLRGIASTLIQESSILSKIDCDWGIWEADEATVPEAAKSTSPKILVLINLFRDQLDRYGEVDTTRAKWQKTIESLARETTLILNADDPGVSYLGRFHKGKVIYFGVNDKKLNLPQISHVADIRYCLNCTHKLIYETQLSSHMGHYSCSNCNFKRPEPTVNASNLDFKPDFSTNLQLTINLGPQSTGRGPHGTVYSPLTINYSLPGLYNVYNVLAAASVASALDLDPQTIKETASSFSAAFGRFQKIKIGQKTIITFLIKNPAGANEVLRIISKKNKLNILTILNDNIADGHDVSWIWDTDWEILSSRVKQIAVSGTRVWDMANRLKYAGIELSKDNIYKEVYYSITSSVQKLDTKGTLLILPTYTALLAIQKTLSRLGGQTKWQKQ